MQYYIGFYGIVLALWSVFAHSTSISVCIYICLFLSMFICLPMCLCISVSLRFCLYISGCFFICLLVLVSPCVCMYVCLYVAECLSVCLSACLFAYPLIQSSRAGYAKSAAASLQGWRGKKPCAAADEWGDVYCLRFSSPST